jgi:hypothetical protein
LARASEAGMEMGSPMGLGFFGAVTVLPP